jgi:hypothetical protein
VLGIGLRIKVKNSKGIQHVILKQIKYVWHIGNLVRYVKDLFCPKIKATATFNSFVEIVLL